jgi:hypothetical protein
MAWRFIGRTLSLRQTHLPQTRDFLPQGRAFLRAFETRKTGGPACVSRTTTSSATRCRNPSAGGARCRADDLRVRPFYGGFSRPLGAAPSGSSALASTPWDGCRSMLRKGSLIRVLQRASPRPPNHKVVQDTLGRANLGMTLGVYSHVQAAMKDEWLQRWMRFFERVSVRLV